MLLVLQLKGEYLCAHGHVVFTRYTTNVIWWLDSSRDLCIVLRLTMCGVDGIRLVLTEPIFPFLKNSVLLDPAVMNGSLV